MPVTPISIDNKMLQFTKSDSDLTYIFMFNLLSCHVNMSCISSSTFPKSDLFSPNHVIILSIFETGMCFSNKVN